VTPVSYDEAGGLASALVALHERGHSHVLIEAGPALLTSAWDDGLIDELVLYHAGGMLGAEAPGVYAGAGDAEGSTLRARMGVCEAGIAGSDAVTVWRPLTSETHR
jgi:riboflavin biosynthesis pyrimidine reductase